MYIHTGVYTRDTHWGVYTPGGSYSRTLVVIRGLILTTTYRKGGGFFKCVVVGEWTFWTLRFGTITT